MSFENNDYHYTDDDIQRMILSEMEEAMSYFDDEDKEKNSKNAGQDKIDEYVDRIKNGETIDSFGNIPDSWKDMIMERMGAEYETHEIDLSSYPMIPTKLQSFENDPELLDEMWVLESHIDEHKNKELKAWKERGLEHARRNSINRHFNKERESNNIEGDISKQDKKEIVIDIEKNKKLSDWAASYELARIAKLEGVDLSTLDREEYVEYAIKNYLAIWDRQLRAHPSQRNCTSMSEVILANKLEEAKIDPETEKRFAKFSFEMKTLAEKPQQERFLSHDVRVYSGTKDSDSWLYFAINKGLDDSSSETYKSYFAFKDLNTLTPERFVTFMILLQDNGYNGSVKIFQDLEFQAARLSDQVVMHGMTEHDSKMALDLAIQFFGDDMGTKSFGKDEVINGESKSYSEILAERISERIKSS